METRHDLDNDGRSEFYRFIDDDLVVGVTINELQQVEKIQYKFSQPSNKIYLEADYKRVGKSFRLVSKFTISAVYGGIGHAAPARIVVPFLI